MKFRRILLIAWPVLGIAGLVSFPVAADTVAEITRDVCFKANDADADGKRAIDEKLFSVLKELKANVRQKDEQAKAREDELRNALMRVENIKLDIVQLEEYQIIIWTFRAAAEPWIGNIVPMDNLRQEIEKEQDPVKKQELQKRYDELEAESDAAAKNFSSLDKSFIHSLRKRIPNRSDLNFGEGIYEVNQTLIAWESGISNELAKSRASLPDAESESIPFENRFRIALIDANDARGRLEVMERVILDTRACIAGARQLASRTDFQIYFRTYCNPPDVDTSGCVHGTHWMNFDAAGRSTGELGFGQICGIETDRTGRIKRECFDAPPFNVISASGQVAAGVLNTTIRYIIPSNQARKDNGHFEFTGTVQPRGDFPQRTWHGSGTFEAIEYKYPEPPLKHRIIACQGTWETETPLLCGGEMEQLP